MSLYETHGPEIKTLYEAGMSMPKIAEKYAVAYPTIRTVLLKQGVVFRSSGVTGRRPDRDLFRPEQVEEIKSRLLAGENMAAIGRAMGTTQTTIDRYAKRLGLHKSRKEITPHMQEISERICAGADPDSIASEFGTTRTNLRVLMHKRGIKLGELVDKAHPYVERTKEEIYRAQYTRNKEREAVDPAFHQAMLDKYKRARKAKEAKYTPTLDKFFASGCAVCRDKRKEGLDAHHRDPKQKLFTVGCRKREKVTAEQLEAELAKCECLCAYCHRVRHFEQGDNRASPNSKSKTALQVAAARIRLKPVFDEFYATGCWVCGRKHPAGLSAHHVYPETKSFNVSKAPFWRLSNERTKSELDKCACLCETCHRLIHAEELECPLEPLTTKTI